MFDGLYKSQDGAALRFFEDAEQNNAATSKHGRPIFDQCLYVEVIAPGSRESAPVFLLERKYADEVGIAEPYRGPKYEQYKKQIDAYRNGNGSADLRGTPLNAWPRMTVALVATAHAAGIYTVEGLAELPDSRLSAFGPGALELRAQARTFVEAAAGNAPGEALAAENERLRADLETLRAQVAELGARQAAPEPQEAAPEASKASEPAPPPAAAPEAPKAAGGGKRGGNALPII